MEQENNKKEIYEVQTNLSVSSGFKFGLGLGMGFFISGLVISFVSFATIFTIFAGPLNDFLQSVSDPFGIKNNNTRSIQNNANANTDLNMQNIQKMLNGLK